MSRQQFAGQRPEFAVEFSFNLIPLGLGDPATAFCEGAPSVGAASPFAGVFNRNAVKDKCSCLFRDCEPDAGALDQFAPGACEPNQGRWTTRKNIDLEHTLGRLNVVMCLRQRLDSGQLRAPPLQPPVDRDGAEQIGPGDRRPLQPVDRLAGFADLRIAGVHFVHQCHREALDVGGIGRIGIGLADQGL